MGKQDILTGMLLFLVPPFGFVARLGALESSFARPRFRTGVGGVLGGVLGSEVWSVLVGFGVSFPESTRACKTARFSGVNSRFFNRDEVSKCVEPICEKLCIWPTCKDECAFVAVASAWNLSSSLSVGVHVPEQAYPSMVGVVMADPSGSNFSYVIRKTWLLYVSIASVWRQNIIQCPDNTKHNFSSMEYVTFALERYCIRLIHFVQMGWYKRAMYWITIRPDFKIWYKVFLTERIAYFLYCTILVYVTGPRFVDIYYRFYWHRIL